MVREGHESGMTVEKPNFPKLFLRQESVFESLEFLDGDVGIYSARCPGKTTANEDSVAIIPFDENSGVLVVADGMGGHAAGDLASMTAVQEMAAAIIDARESDQILRSGIINGFERANESVMALARGAGTTLAVAEIGSGWARAYHAGDSVVLIVSSHGNIKLETNSHSPVGLGLEAGFLDIEEAANHENRHLVLNAIGSKDMRIDIGSPVKLAKRDTVLIASDGLTDNLPLGEVVEMVRRGRLETSMTRLVESCTQRMVNGGLTAKPDDLTVLIYRPTGKRLSQATEKGQQ